jgi:hypothetical protein
MAKINLNNTEDKEEAKPSREVGEGCPKYLCPETGCPAHPENCSDPPKQSLKGEIGKN